MTKDSVMPWLEAEIQEKGEDHEQRKGIRYA